MSNGKFNQSQIMPDDTCAKILADAAPRLAAAVAAVKGNRFLTSDRKVKLLSKLAVYSTADGVRLVATSKIGAAVSRVISRETKGYMANANEIRMAADAAAAETSAAMAEALAPVAKIA